MRVCQNNHVTGAKKCPLCGTDAEITLVRAVDPPPISRTAVLARQRPTLLQRFVSPFRNWRKAHREKVAQRRAATTDRMVREA